MLISTLEELGASVGEPMPAKARWAVQRQWRDAFARGWNDWSGPLRDFDWHVFSYRYVEHLARARAIAAFEARDDTKLIAAVDLGTVWVWAHTS